VGARMAPVDGRTVGVARHTSPVVRHQLGAGRRESFTGLDRGVLSLEREALDDARLRGAGRRALIDAARCYGACPR
jgi:hypothetical protein